MNWNDYEAVWKRQELPVGAAADVAALRETFESKHRKLAATLLVRDWIEAAAGIFVSLALAFIWWRQGRTGWPLALAIGLILWVTVFFIRERIRAHRNRLGAEAPLLAKLEADIAELRHQRRLLLGVWTWYLAPCLAAILIVLATVILSVPAWALRGHLLFLLGYLPLLGLLLWFVWFINRRAVRRQIEPRLEELEKLHRDLVAGEGQATPAAVT